MLADIESPRMTGIKARRANRLSCADLRIKSEPTAVLKTRIQEQEAKITANCPYPEAPRARARNKLIGHVEQHG